MFCTFFGPTGSDGNEKLSRCAKWGGVRRHLSEAEALHECLSKIWDIHEQEVNAGNWTPGQKRPPGLYRQFLRWLHLGDSDQSLSKNNMGDMLTTTKLSILITPKD